MFSPETTILETVHGSYLYGLDHADSDEDLFRVVARRTKPKVHVYQRGNKQLDFTEFGLDDFLKNIYHGSPQSIEALFSPYAYMHPAYESMFRNMRVMGSGTHAAYRRTIKKFAYGDLKQRRHAVRLGYNLSELRRVGRFNPVLTDNQVIMVRAMAKVFEGDKLYDIATNNL